MANKEKQIDEMAKVIARRSVAFRNPNVAFMTTATKTAESLYNADYRKASDVAREIFEEIEEGIKAAVSALQFENNPIHRQVKHETYSSLMRFIKSVEEKYTKED